MGRSDFPPGFKDVLNFSLVQGLLGRRSRRFFMGAEIPLSFSNIIWFAVMGVASYLTFVTITSGAKMARFMMKPFSGMFARKPVEKVIIREKEKDD